MLTIATADDTFTGSAATSALVACLVLTVVILAMLVAVWRRR